MGLLRGIGSAPGIAIGLFAGVWIDRVHRRRLLIALDLVAAATDGFNGDEIRSLFDTQGTSLVENLGTHGDLIGREVAAISETTLRNLEERSTTLLSSLQERTMELTASYVQSTEAMRSAIDEGTQQTVETLTGTYLPLLLRAAGDISADFARDQSVPVSHVERPASSAWPYVYVTVAEVVVPPAPASKYDTAAVPFGSRSGPGVGPRRWMERHDVRVAAHRHAAIAENRQNGRHGPRRDRCHHRPPRVAGEIPGQRGEQREPDHRGAEAAQQRARIDGMRLAVDRPQLLTGDQTRRHRRAPGPVPLRHAPTRAGRGRIPAQGCGPRGKLSSPAILELWLA